MTSVEELEEAFKNTASIPAAVRIVYTTFLHAGKAETMTKADEYRVAANRMARRLYNELVGNIPDRNIADAKPTGKEKYAKTAEKYSNMIQEAMYLLNVKPGRAE
jgi:hypothetical protein